MLRNWCSWHKGYEEGTKLVRIIETGSGPGGMLYACLPCRESNGLTPLADHSDDSDSAPVPRCRT